MPSIDSTTRNTASATTVTVSSISVDAGDLLVVLVDAFDEASLPGTISFTSDTLGTLQWSTGLATQAQFRNSNVDAFNSAGQVFSATATSTTTGGVTVGCVSCDFMWCEVHVVSDHSGVVQVKGAAGDANLVGGTGPTNLTMIFASAPAVTSLVVATVGFAQYEFSAGNIAVTPGSDFNELAENHYTEFDDFTIQSQSRMGSMSDQVRWSFTNDEWTWVGLAVEIADFDAPDPPPPTPGPSTPRVYVESTFGEGPAGGPWLTWDDPTRGLWDTAKWADDALGSGFWTDLASFTYRWSTARGRQRLLDNFETGRLNAELDNSDRRFDSTNLAGPYVAAGKSLVKPMRPVRLRVEWGYEQVTLPGAAADFVSLGTGDLHSALTDLHVEWTGRADWQTLAAASDQQLIGRWGAAGDRSWRVLLRQGGTIRLEWSTDGTASVTEDLTWSTSTFPDDELIHVKVTLDVDNGAGGYTATLTLTSREGTATATDTNTGGAATSIFHDNAATLSIGGGPNSNAVVGSVVEAFLFSNIEGRWVAAFDARWVVPGTVDGNGDEWAIPHRTPNLAGNVWTLKGATAGAGTGVYHLFRGFADDWPVRWEYPSVSVCNLAASDGFKVFARIDRNAGSLVGTGDTTAARLDRIADAAGWPDADRDFDTGKATFQSTDLAANALTELKLTGETEGPGHALYVDGEGRLRFRDRHHRYDDRRARQAAWTIGDGGGLELPFARVPAEPGFATDDELVINKASIAREGGVAQVAEDAASQGEFLLRETTRTNLLHQTDEVSADYAGLLIAIFKDREERFTSLSFDVTGDTRMWPFVLGVDIGDRLAVRARPPGGGSPIEREVFVEGIEHSFDREEGHWYLVLQLASATPWTALVWDDPILGQLDQGNYWGF